MVVAMAALMLFVVIFIVVVMVAVAALVFILIVVIVVVMMSAAAFFAVFIVVVVMVMVVMMGILARLFFKLRELRLEGVALSDCRKNLRAADFRPGGGHDGGVRILFTNFRDAVVQFFLGNVVGVAQNDSRGVFDLVEEELAEVLGVDFELVGVHNGYRAADLGLFVAEAGDGADDVAQFADAGGLDENALGLELVDDLVEGLAEVAHETAADATGVHLGDLDSCVLHEAAVDADLAEFVLD